MTEIRFQGPLGRWVLLISGMLLARWELSRSSAQENIRAELHLGTLRRTGSEFAKVSGRFHRGCEVRVKLAAFVKRIYRKKVGSETISCCNTLRTVRPH